MENLPNPVTSGGWNRDMDADLAVAVQETYWSSCCFVCSPTSDCPPAIQHSNWKWPIYSWFTFKKWCFSTVLLLYQRGIKLQDTLSGRAILCLLVLLIRNLVPVLMIFCQSWKFSLEWYSSIDLFVYLSLPSITVQNYNIYIHVETHVEPQQKRTMVVEPTASEPPHWQQS